MLDQLAIEGGQPVRTRPFPSWPRVTDKTARALQCVLDSGHWWQSGEGKAEELEAWLASYHGVAGAVAVTNGTHALELAIRSLGIGSGDEVVVPGLTFISTASAVSLVGATPVPADIDPETLCIEPEDLKRTFTTSTRAVLPVHLAGQPAAMSSILALAGDAGLQVVEDCAQAIGAEWQGQRVGGFGTLAIHSFHASKLLPAGEGGAVLVKSDPELLQRIVLMSNCGRPRGALSHEHQLVGSNYRMTEFQAGLLLAQISEYEHLWKRRQAAADALTGMLREEQTAIPVSAKPGVTRMAWFHFLIRMPSDLCARITNHRLAEILTAEGIPARPIYPPFYATPAYRRLYGEIRCPNAQRASEEVIFLHHSLLLDGQAGVQDIAAAFRKIWRRVVCEQAVG